MEEIILKPLSDDEDDEEYSDVKDVKDIARPDFPQGGDNILQADCCSSEVSKKSDRMAKARMVRDSIREENKRKLAHYEILLQEKYERDAEDALLVEKKQKNRIRYQRSKNKKVKTPPKGDIEQIEPPKKDIEPPKTTRREIPIYIREIKYR